MERNFNFDDIFPEDIKKSVLYSSFGINKFDPDDYTEILHKYQKHRSNILKLENIDEQIKYFHKNFYVMCQQFRLFQGTGVREALKFMVDYNK